MRSRLFKSSLLTAALVASVAALTAMAIPTGAAPPTKHATLGAPPAALVVDSGQIQYDISITPLAAAPDIVAVPDTVTLTSALQNHAIEAFDVAKQIPECAIEYDVGAVLSAAAEQASATTAIVAKNPGAESITGPPLQSVAAVASDQLSSPLLALAAVPGLAAASSS